MPNSLDITARQTLFLLRGAGSTRKITFASDWQTREFHQQSELENYLEQARVQRQRAIVVVDEEGLPEVLAALRGKARPERAFRYGILLVAADPSERLKRDSTPEILDVVSEKEFKKGGPELHLLRALRQLLRVEARSNSRIGQQMLEKLNEIFIDLSAERNPQRLLATILVKAMDLTLATGGLLYMVQETDGELYFRLRITNDQSDEVKFQHLSNKVVENSVCGYVALTGKLLNISDVSMLRPMSLPQYHKSVDYSDSDKMLSILTIPLKNSRNEIIAVLQLVNKMAEEGAHDSGATAFEDEDGSLLTSFAAQAATCMENVDLYADIQRLFEGFVKAAISAIESRDPSTGGHSERVAKMCVALARATTECEVGIYRSVKFKEEEIRELEYAALLHDFGKIGVREEVLVKAKKLYPYQLEGIRDRIKICKAAAKIAYLEKRLKHGGAEPSFEREYQQRMKEIEAYWEIILAANEPTILKKESIETLDRIRSDQLLLPDGAQISVLSEDEYQALAVTQGSLTESERLEIESHVRHTYQFLKMIPWTKDFRHLTEIAYCHHEKLDGSGYPRGMSSHEIPLQSKIMTISDIFDALTAADRWYKEAVPTEKALAILHDEVTQGKLDPVLVELFVEKRIYELTQPKEMNKVA